VRLALLSLVEPLLLLLILLLLLLLLLLLMLFTDYDNGAKFILSLYASPNKPGHCLHIGQQILVKSYEVTVQLTVLTVH
jgi:hypothetical protein